MTVAILRADGSSTLGMGHIMRCLALAVGLKASDIEPVFVTRKLGVPVAQVVRDKGYSAYEIQEDSTAAEDARLTKEIAVNLGAKFIFTDVCHNETQAKPNELTGYHQALAQDFFTLAMTGDQDIDLPVDIVIYPYIGGGGPKIPASEKQTVVLVGPSYFMFRPEFIEAAQSTPDILEKGSRVMVSVGGADEHHTTSKIVKALCSLTDQDLSVRIVIGTAYTDRLRNEINGLLNGLQGAFEILESSTNMAASMQWADISVTGDGLIKYEAAIIGTPCLTLSRPESAMSLNRAFEKTGSSILLGDGTLIDTDQLAAEIKRVLNDQELRASMSNKGRALVDGKGVDRIISAIKVGILG
jgi:spore coat polysaccharide biosynthesis predicted glycosyltransferase SpsG